MKVWRISCVAVVAAVAFGVLAVAAAGASTEMTPRGLQAYGDTYTAIANSYAARANGTAMTPAGLNAYGQTYQQMAMSYLTADQPENVPVQWHDVFTGVGATLGVVLLLGAGVFTTRNRHHTHYGRPTLAH